MLLESSQLHLFLIWFRKNRAMEGRSRYKPKIQKGSQFLINLPNIIDEILYLGSQPLTQSIEKSEIKRKFCPKFDFTSGRVRRWMCLYFFSIRKIMISLTFFETQSLQIIVLHFPGKLTSENGHGQQSKTSNLSVSFWQIRFFTQDSAASFQENSLITIYFWSASFFSL